MLGTASSGNLDAASSLIHFPPARNSNRCCPACAQGRKHRMLRL
jgi:hypothetical protein